MMRFKLKFSASVAFGLVASGAAWAQATPEPMAAQQDTVDVIIVTGVGPARASGELIVSTTALETDDVTDRLTGGLGDTLAGLPGISSTSFGPGASRPVIRGLGAERVQVLTNGIGVIDASAASPDHAVTGDPLGAERIEILRGPATLAYGGGAAGGVVNVIDGLIAERPPAETVSALGYAGYTSADDGVNLAARATGAAGPAVATVSWSRKEAGDLEIPGLAESARLRVLEEEEDEEHAHVPGRLENSGVESETFSGGLSLAGDTGFAGVSIRRSETRYGIVGGHGDEHQEAAAASGLSPLAIGVAAVGDAPEQPFIDLEQTRLDLRGGFRLAEGPVERFTMAVSGVDYTHTEFEGPGEPGTRFTANGYEARVEVQHADYAG